MLGFATFIACLVLALEIGILIGVGINLLFILYHAARPKISVEKLQVREILCRILIIPQLLLKFLKKKNRSD